MNRYPVHGTTLRTTSTRRWLVVSVYDGRAKVEASTDDENAAARLLGQYRREFAPTCRLLIIDQANQGGQ